jgi:hypothetical protein
MGGGSNTGHSFDSFGENNLFLLACSTLILKRTMRSKDKRKTIIHVYFFNIYLPYLKKKKTI